MSIWAYPTAAPASLSAKALVLQSSATASNTNQFALYVDTSSKMNFGHAGGTLIGIPSVASVNLNAWNHFGGVEFSATSIRGYLNGVGRLGGTSSQVPSGIDSTVVGVDYATGPSVTRPFIGALAEAAVWNVALTDADMLALNAGVSPLKIRPDALVFYAPLFGRNSPENDVKSNARALAVTGSLPLQAHPRIFRPRKGL